ncbi:enoyl-CoA hydratase/isomerase family protein [Rhodobacteraceae bacterium NNCM2]|nr:enoyl-CoA hydratase/isomerase family protein [Coraliihabitans acroporae]
MNNFTYEVDGDVAVITWDIADKTMNVIDPGFNAELEALVDKYLADEAVKGAVFTSGKKDLGAGADLNMLAAAKQQAIAAGGDVAEAMFEFSMGLHRVLRKIERGGADPKTNKGGKPMAVASPGTMLGGVYEIALAAHRRIVADNPKAKIGLPEVMVGVFPGGGGATRLPRMLGLMGSGEFLLQGKTVEPKKAKSAGLVDEVVPAEELLARAKEWVRNSTEADAVKPWDEKKFKFPGGAPYTAQGFMMFVGAMAMAHGKTMGNLVNVEAMLSAIYEGAMLPMDQALKVEARWFTHVLMQPQTEAMIRSVFLNKQALEKGAVRPDGIPDQSVSKVGVLGAGMMGAGIAYVSANAGIEVVLLDRDIEAAEKGKAHSAGILDRGISRKKVTEEKKAEVLARIHATSDYADLAGCDLIVEAVFEDPGVKAEVTAATEAVIPEDAIFASNTSTLPITGLAKASKRPEQFIGIHFFSPVDRMMLVEIIKGKQTGDRAVAKALDFVRQIRKVPIVVNDARYFYANRCIIPYVNEAGSMVAEGVAPALIENAGRLMGMPVPPLQLNDETSLDLGAKILRATMEQMGDSYVKGGADDMILKMVDELERYGRKNGKGFYTYDEKGKRQGLWPGLAEHFPPKNEQPDVEEVKTRLILTQVLEAVRALEEDVLLDIREGDVGAIFGWGFMPWSGGPLSWIDITGPAKVVEMCEAMTEKHGPRFEAPELLRDIARKGETFYGRFQPGAKAA